MSEYDKWLQLVPDPAEIRMRLEQARAVLNEASRRCAWLEMVMQLAQDQHQAPPQPAPEPAPAPKRRKRPPCFGNAAYCVPGSETCGACPAAADCAKLCSVQPPGEDVQPNP